MTSVDVKTHKQNEFKCYQNPVE